MRLGLRDFAGDAAEPKRHVGHAVAIDALHPDAQLLANRQTVLASDGADCRLRAVLDRQNVRRSSTGPEGRTWDVRVHAGESTTGLHEQHHARRTPPRSHGPS
jgi:hypothetical protein